MSRLIAAGLAFCLGIGIGKWGCGSGAEADRKRDLKRAEEEMIDSVDRAKRAKRAWDDAETTRVDPTGWSIGEPEGGPRRGTIVLEPGMVVDPVARIVYRVPVRASLPTLLEVEDDLKD